MTSDVHVDLEYVSAFNCYVQVHLRHCPKITINCSNEKCGTQLTRESLKDHLENDCLYQMVSCEYCHQENPRKQLQAHMATDCQQIVMECPSKCKLSLKRSEVVS
jgi:hypothetical protein